MQDQNIINDQSVFLRRIPPPDNNTLTTMSDNSYVSAAESVSSVIYPFRPTIKNFDNNIEPIKVHHIRKFLGGSVHVIPRGFAQKYVEFHTFPISYMDPHRISWTYAENTTCFVTGYSENTGNI
ncbi:unnamed protein product [Rhizophagus irregularis]|nr:unnamed protein product [Rhizophagus irregularis]